MGLFNTDDLGVKPVSKNNLKKIEVPVTVNEEDIIKINRSFTIDEDSFFTKDKFPHGFVFYDFEVFQYDWLVVLIDPINKTKDIIANNRRALKHYYNTHSEMIWVGYNNLHYDVPVLKGILLGMNPKQISDAIIVEGKQPYEINKDFNKIDLLSYDCSDGINSLKVLEAYMGDDIEETEVPFDIQRPLLDKELKMTMKYCIHDVKETIEVFKRRINDFNSSMNIIELFDFPISCISKTKGQLTALVTDCEAKEHNDEFNITILPCIELNKYKYIQDWFVEACKNKNYKAKLEANVCGIPHQFGWGGLHGASDKPAHIKGRLFHADVGSYYPSQMIEWDLLTRNCKQPQKFKEVYDTRMALKKAGKKKEQAPYKTILNSQYGIMKDKFSAAFDPVQANNICINGQLMLLDLIEHLESKMGDLFELVQSNTDGIIVKIQDDDKTERIFKHICNEWCIRTRMTFAYDRMKWYIAKDVNNYAFLFDNGKHETKGAYVKELSDLDNDLPIVNEALNKFIFDDIPVEDTINNCNEMIKFQKVFRVSKSYKYAIHNNIKYSEKTFRVYASKDKNDGYLGRCKQDGSTVEKFANCPDHCFIYNKSVKDMPMSIKVDRNWYIKLAKKRLEDFGYDIKNENSLF